ncbi:MAG: ABC transporter ATP-binding protein [Pseudomonadota bacterium]
MHSDALLSIRGLSKSFGALKASDNITLDVDDGELHAVIGPNGAGKTTMIAQICGQLEPDTGTVLFAGQNITSVPQQERPAIGLVRSFQITSIFPDFTAIENVAMAVQLNAGHSFQFIAPAATDSDLVGPAKTHLEQVGLADQAAVMAFALSHGQQRRLELAMALALKPRLLVLDEPMAGMGAEETAGVVQFLKGLKGKISMLLVEHDMDAVFALADRVSVLVYGRVIASGAPQDIRRDQAVIDAYLGSGDEEEEHA